MAEGIGTSMHWAYWTTKRKTWKSFREYTKRAVHDSGFQVVFLLVSYSLLFDLTW